MDKGSADDKNPDPLSNSSYSTAKERVEYKKASEYNKPIAESSTLKKDNWHEWLTKIAGICIAEPEIKNNVRWIEEHFAPADILISPKLTAALARGIPIEGSSAGIRAKAGELSLQVLGEGSKRWKFFARGTLAATLREMEKRGTTAEDEIDVLVSALNAVDFKLMPAAIDIVLAARERLSEQINRTHGYYATRAMVAGVLSELKDEKSRQTRCHLYWEVLSEVRAIDKGKVSERGWAKLINSVARDLASTLDDLGEGESCTAYMKLSIIAKIAERNLDHSTSSFGDVSEGLSSLFQGHYLSTADILDSMGSVPSAWNKIGFGQQLTFLVQLGAAVAQSEIEPRQNGVSKSLFNAGVALAQTTEKIGEKRFLELSKAVLYAAGLTWALSRRSGEDQKDFVEAMKDNVGANSCAVNLMGSLISLPILQAQPDLIDKFSGTLLWIDGAFDESAKSRLNLYRSRAKLKRGSISENPLGPLNTIISTCLSDEAEWKNAWNDFASRPTPGTLGSLLAITGSRCCAEFEQVKRSLADLLEGLEEKASDWPEFIFSPELSKVLTKPSWLAEIKTQQDSQRHDQEAISLPDRLISLADRLISD